MSTPEMSRPVGVVFIVFDGMKMLDVTGPAEVFAEANAFGADYRLSYASTSGEPVLTSVGTPLSVNHSTRQLSGADTIVVAGGDSLVTEPVPPDLVDEVRRLHSQARRLVSICTGSFVLAAAGLLSGRRATTHWRHADLLARAYPHVQVQPESLFVEDDGIFTSAGVSAGIDLALALVEQDHGPDLARHVARNLVVFMRRPGGQSQFSASLAVRTPRTPTLRGVVDRISAEPGLDHSASALAAGAGVSQRQLNRLFASELDVTPARFVQRIRLDHARALLDAGHAVAETARVSGFGSPETMRRAFVALLGVPPSQYRARFATTIESVPDS